MNSHKIKLKITLFIFIALILTLILTSYKAYTTIQCSDLEYSLNHYVTQNNLQRIRYKKLVFLDTDTAVFKSYGLCTTKPYKTIGLVTILRKDKLGIWYVNSNTII